MSYLAEMSEEKSDAKKPKIKKKFNAMVFISKSRLCFRFSFHH